MKSKILKGIVVASAIALVNCGENAVNPADYINPQAELSSSSFVDGGVDLSSADAAGSNGANPGVGLSSSAEGENLPFDPTLSSSAGVNPNDPWDDPCVSSSLPDACGSGTNPVPASSADAQGQGSVVDTVPAVASSSSAVVALSSAVVPDPASSSAGTPAVQSSSSEATSSATVASSSSEAPKGIFLASGTEEEKDQMQVEYKTRTGWDGAGILSYPKQLSSTQKHGVVVWGPGGGTEPGAYEGMIRRLASHGFVVIALKESPGDASQAIKALDWMDRQNKDPNSPLYNKLDMNTVGCSGHSMGGLESEQAVIKDKRVLTAFLNNSGDWNGAGANKVATDRSIAILFGEVGMEKDNAKNDYNNAGVKAPACLIEMTGGPRNSEGGYGHGSGSWDGMAATVAWMRWHLGGETNRKADFVGSTGKYIDGSIIGKQGKWKTQCKNF